MGIKKEQSKKKNTFTSLLSPKTIVSVNHIGTLVALNSIRQLFFIISASAPIPDRVPPFSFTLASHAQRQPTMASNPSEMAPKSDPSAAIAQEILVKSLADFRFQPRSGSLNMKRLSSVNVDNIKRLNNTDHLSNIIKRTNVIGAELDAEDFDFISGDLLVKVFKLTQMSLEVNEHKIRVLSTELNKLNRSYQIKKADLKKSEKNLMSRDEEVAMLRDELYHCKEELKMAKENNHSSGITTPIDASLFPSQERRVITSAVDSTSLPRIPSSSTAITAMASNTTTTMLQPQPLSEEKLPNEIKLHVVSPSHGLHIPLTVESTISIRNLQNKVMSKCIITTDAAPLSAVTSRNPRDMLLDFYHTHNPTKVNEVDKLLVKYAGNEVQMCLNLAKKYNKDPSTFGITTQVPKIAPALGGAGGVNFEEFRLHYKGEELPLTGTLEESQVVDESVLVILPISPPNQPTEGNTSSTSNAIEAKLDKIKSMLEHVAITLENQAATQEDLPMTETASCDNISADTSSMDPSLGVNDEQQATTDNEVEASQTEKTGLKVDTAAANEEATSEEWPFGLNFDTYHPPSEIKVTSVTAEVEDSPFVASNSTPNETVKESELQSSPRNVDICDCDEGEVCDECIVASPTSAEAVVTPFVNHDVQEVDGEDPAKPTKSVAEQFTFSEFDTVEYEYSCDKSESEPLQITAASGPSDTDDLQTIEMSLEEFTQTSTKGEKKKKNRFGWKKGEKKKKTKFTSKWKSLKNGKKATPMDF